LRELSPAARGALLLGGVDVSSSASRSFQEHSLGGETCSGLRTMTLLGTTEFSGGVLLRTILKGLKNIWEASKKDVGKKGERTMDI